MQTYSRQLAEIQEDLKVTRAERERLEQNNERLRKDLQMAQNPDVAYGQVRTYVRVYVRMCAHMCMYVDDI